MKDLLVTIEDLKITNNLKDIFDLKPTLIELDRVLEQIVFKQTEYHKRKRNKKATLRLREYLVRKGKYLLINQLDIVDEEEEGQIPFSRSNENSVITCDIFISNSSYYSNAQRKSRYNTDYSVSVNGTKMRSKSPQKEIVFTKEQLDEIERKRQIIIKLKTKKQIENEDTNQLALKKSE
ncbi:UNKNOWN [Stylonychia lemnae]|uniref:Uncharacterized protein n=1 Tax=Stylonychia lemnae TaxID=5949 RepID=A0A077ZRB5_STYLE|nr:UNKNOWN [Stylonychia lemnae]|eukprot:CDW72437.1 UNKNOWN [Stylonychia lemnae]